MNLLGGISPSVDDCDPHGCGSTWTAQCKVSRHGCGMWARWASEVSLFRWARFPWVVPFLGLNQGWPIRNRGLRRWAAGFFFRYLHKYIFGLEIYRNIHHGIIRIHLHSME